MSVVVPVLDEEGCVAELSRRVLSAVEQTGSRAELIFVDDGSMDRTPQRIAELHAQDPRIKSIRLARRFGHQAALMTGLAHVQGDAVVTMDGDLQHPPELIPEFLEAWRRGADVVHAVRQDRPQTGFWKRLTSRLFYLSMRLLTSLPIVPAAADFRLLDRRMVEELNALPERLVFVRGLVPWLGFRETQIHYESDERFAGESKYDLVRMLRLALDGIFSFSIVPLRAIALLGIVTTLLGVGYGVFALAAWMCGEVEDTGWTSLMVVVLVFGGVQLLSLGIISEYLARVYEEAKRRPRAVVESTLGVETP